MPLARRLQKLERALGAVPQPPSAAEFEARMAAIAALPEPERCTELLRWHRELLQAGPPPSRPPTPAEWRARFAQDEREPRFARDARWTAALRGWRQAGDAEAREVWFHRLLVESLRLEGAGCDCGGCRGCRDGWTVEDAPAP
jgi:hypothetical protein